MSGRTLCASLCCERQTAFVVYVSLQTWAAEGFRIKAQRAFYYGRGIFFGRLFNDCASIYSKQSCIIQLKPCTEQSQYGDRDCPFEDGVSATWEQRTTDLKPVSRVWGIVETLVTEYKMVSSISLVGFSAG
eukprot:4012287-Karenia_brevis.AAC.1